MSSKPFHTVGEIALDHGVPNWQARRAVDALGVEIPRAGHYRLVPSELLGRVSAEIVKLRMRSRREGRRP